MQRSRNMPNIADVFANQPAARGLKVTPRYGNRFAGNVRRDGRFAVTFGPVGKSQNEQQIIQRIVTAQRRAKRLNERRSKR
jgi:hypothetical protein